MDGMESKTHGERDWWKESEPEGRDGGGESD